MPEPDRGLGRRTLHALMPVLAYGEDGKLEAAVGTMDGDAQPQLLAQILWRRLLDGEPIEGAIAAPRRAARPPGDTSV